MADESEMLLDAEKAVQEVLRSAVQLRDEAARHGSAHGALSDARDVLVSLAADLSACASSLAGAVAAMNAAGTPEILTQVRQLAEQSRTDTDRVIAESAAAASQLRGDLSNLAGGRISDVQTELASSHREVKRLGRRVNLLMALVLVACVGSVGAALLQVPQVRASIFP